MAYRVEPTLPQYQFLFSQLKYPAFVGGFGSGKTEGLVLRSIINKLKYPTLNRAFYEPTYDLIRQIAWPRFEETLTAMQVPYRLHKSPHNLIEVEGRGRIIFRSMDNPARIIGYEVGDSDVDELDTLKPKDSEEAWRRILSRNRQTDRKNAPGHINTAAVATTPEGFGFVYRRWEDSPGKGYGIIKAPTWSNPHLPQDYIQNLKDDYPDHLIQAYIEGNFVNLTSGTVYLAFGRDDCASVEEVKKDDPLFIGMDFNVGNMSAVIHVKRKGQPHAVNEITKALDTPDIIHIIKQRWPSHEILVYPDSTGGSRKSVDASKTDIALLRAAGFTVMGPRKNPRVRDRVNAMNAAFKNGYKVNLDKCPVYVKCLEQQVYNDNGEPDKTQDLDHLPDAGGYFINKEYPLIKPAMTLNIGMAT